MLGLSVGLFVLSVVLFFAIPRAPQWELTGLIIKNFDLDQNAIEMESKVLIHNGNWVSVELSHNTMQIGYSGTNIGEGTGSDATLRRRDQTEIPFAMNISVSPSVGLMLLLDLPTFEMDIDGYADFHVESLGYSGRMHSMCTVEVDVAQTPVSAKQKSCTFKQV